MRGVHVDDHEPLRVLREHVDAVNLPEGEAERLCVGGVIVKARRTARCPIAQAVAVPAGASLRPNSAS